MSQRDSQHELDGRVVGEAIRRARKEAGLSNAGLARALSVGERTVTRWQAGVLTPSLPRLYAIAQTLNKPVAYFLELENAA